MSAYALQEKVTDIGKNQKPMLDKGGGDCTHPPFTEAFYMQIYRIKISKSFINLITLYFNYSLCCNGCDICLMKVSKVHILKNHGTCCICEFFLKCDYLSSEV